MAYEDISTFYVSETTSLFGEAQISQVGSRTGTPRLEGQMPVVSPDLVRLVVSKLPDSMGELGDILAVVRAEYPNAQVLFVAPPGRSNSSKKTSCGLGDAQEPPGLVDEAQACCSDRISDAPLSPGAGQLDRPTNLKRFSPRQAEVVRGLARGLSNKSIARELGLSESTVKVHVISVFRALNVHSRASAISAVFGSEALRAELDV
ncbi:helix-turn-helix domain-containing protein [Palleronia marisminoris]|uniref:helix-turn-helix domain-containing protein n=1 Tax=Palleronia marisminoris TaxID=315423 RepID=UPI000A267D87|nr:LuxR C-terminal-related transcriptional regulator [Palleronia marisminoris]